VNPHGLSDAELTQPGDLSVALNREGTGLQLASPVQESASGCVDDALSALDAEEVDVLIYFAHRGATTCAGASAQVELETSVTAHLVRGGGVVVFHHGLYEDPAKTGILQLLGGSASGIAWDEQVGQRVFNVAGDHFVTTNGLVYEGEAPLEGNMEIPSGTFPFFDNIPDERYPDLTLLTEAGETREILFATDTAGTRALGYSLVRAGWSGHVVAYQPGEYQPRALDDLEGQGFQILLNAILYSAGMPTQVAEPGVGGQSGVGGELGAGGEAAVGGATTAGDGGGTGVGGRGDPSGAGAGGGGGDGGDSSPGGGQSGGSVDGENSDTGGSSSGGTATSDPAPNSSGTPSGCAFLRPAAPIPWWALGALVLVSVLTRRRRRPSSP
jgi:hypothetical protein